MTQSLAYEIGAVFLLAALLIGGSSANFLPARFRPGPGAFGAAGAAVAIFAMFHYGGDLWSAFVPSPAVASDAAPQAAASRPSPAPAQHAPAAHAPAASAQHWKTIVVEAAPPVDTVAQDTPVPAEIDAPVAPAEPAAAEPTNDDPPLADPCEKSPYQSKTKRVLKSLGCGLHLIPRK